MDFLLNASLSKKSLQWYADLIDRVYTRENTRKKQDLSVYGYFLKRTKITEMIVRKLMKNWNNLLDCVIVFHKKASYHFFFNKIINYEKQYIIPRRYDVKVNGVIKDTHFIKMADNLMPLEYNVIDSMTNIFEEGNVVNLMID